MASSGPNEASGISDEKRAEVSSARNRLSGALSTAEKIVEKFAGESDHDFVVTSPLKRLQGLDSPFPSPTKSPRTARRRRKKPVPLTTAFHHTFVMKLFDRSVDLAQFADNAALYPVCRAWMKNEPHNTNMAPRIRTPTPEPPAEIEENEEGEKSQEENGKSGEDVQDDDRDTEKPKHPERTTPSPSSSTTGEPKAKIVKRDLSVYRLPPPESLDVDDFGNEMTLRKPQVKRPDIDKKFDISKDQSAAPDASTLLNGHMVRWFEVRRAWKKAAALNEQRYADSMKVLNDMFEK